MASSSGTGAHEDTNENIPEETGLTNPIDEIINEIFMECDQQKQGSVAVSVLIQFVAKYFNNCLTDWRILELKSDLDPEDRNILIDKSTFSIVLPRWVAKLNVPQDNVLSDSCSVNNTNSLFDQSTPSNTESVLLECGNSTNVSNSLSCEIQSSIQEKLDYEERITELLFQNKKLSDELLHTKNQLSCGEEQHEAIQRELESFKKKIRLEHEKSEEFINLQAEYEKFREISETSKIQLEKLHQQYSSVKKENTILCSKLDNLEIEKKLGDDIQEKANVKLEQAVTDLLKLETEFSSKDQEIALLLKSNADLKTILEEQEKDIEYFRNETEKFKTEKLILEKHLTLKERSKGILFPQLLNKMHTGIPSSHEHNQHKNPVPFSPSIENNKFQFYNIDSPFSRIAKEQRELNKSSDSNIRIPRTPVSFPLRSGRSIDSESPNFSDLHHIDQKHSSPNLIGTYMSDMKANSDFNQGTQECETASLKSDAEQHSNIPFSTQMADVPISDLNISNEPIGCNFENSLVSNKQLYPGENAPEYTGEVSPFNKDDLLSNFIDSNNTTHSSLPTLYLMANSFADRKENLHSVKDSTEDVSIKTSRVLTNALDVEDSSLDIHESSSEQDLFWKLPIFDNSADAHESLQDEISQADTNTSNQYGNSINLEHTEENYIQVKCELSNQHSCTYNINKQKEVISQLELERNDYKEKIEVILKQTAELKLELSVENEKNEILNCDNANLKSKLNLLQEYVVGIKPKLVQVEDILNRSSELECNIEELREENTKKFLVILNLQQSLDEKTSMHIEEVLKLNSKIDVLLNENKECCQQRDSLKEELANAQLLINGIQNEIKNMTEQCQNLQADLCSVKSESLHLRSELEKVSYLQDKNNELKIEVKVLNNELQCKNTQLTQQSDEFVSNYEKLKQEYSKFQQDHDSTVQSLELKITDLMMCLKDKEVVLFNLNSSISKINDINLKLLEEKNKSEEDIVILKKSNSEKDALICSWQNTEKKYLNDIEVLNHELTSSKGKKEDLETRYVSIEKEFASLQEKFTSIENETSILTDKLKRLKTEKDDSVGKCKLLEENIESLKVENETKTELINQLNSNLQNSLSDVNCMELNTKQTNKTLCNELVEAKKQLSFKEAKLERLLKDNEELKNTIDLHENIRYKTCDLKEAELENEEPSELTIESEDLNESSQKSVKDSCRCSKEDKDLLLKKVKRIKIERNAFKIKFQKNEEVVCKLMECIESCKTYMCEKTTQLLTATSYLVHSWRRLLEKIPNLEEFLKNIDNGQPQSPTWSFKGPLDSELFRLKHQVHLTCQLLENLAILSEDPTFTVYENKLKSCQETNLASKKIILKPPRLMVCNVSPYSLLSPTESNAREIPLQDKSSSNNELNNNGSAIHESIQIGKEILQEAHSDGILTELKILNNYDISENKTCKKTPFQDKPLNCLLKRSFCTFMVFMFLITAIVSMNLIIEVGLEKHCLKGPTYPFRWISRLEFLVPWVKKEFPYGPPPT